MIFIVKTYKRWGINSEIKLFVSLFCCLSADNLLISEKNTIFAARKKTQIYT